MRLRGPVVGAFFIALLSCACSEGSDAPDPSRLSNWVDLCGIRCHQEETCDYDQFVFDHGNLDYCMDECTYFLEVDANERFLDETDRECLQSIWDEVDCVFELGCDELEIWEEGGAGAACSAEASARETACSGVDADGFLEDCGWPLPVDYEI